MKKIVRLTESDLVRLVKRVINEDYDSRIKTDGKGNVIFNKATWSLKYGWTKIHINSLTQLPNSDYKMMWLHPNILLTERNRESIIPKEKMDGIMKQASAGNVSKINFTIKDENKKDITLTLYKESN